ncbi:Uncharacterised protein [Pasteurella testudinis]|nr:Uncharacterised protein [Pasteurella testudinis]
MAILSLKTRKLFFNNISDNLCGHLCKALVIKKDLKTKVLMSADSKFIMKLFGVSKIIVRDSLSD